MIPALLRAGGLALKHGAKGLRKSGLAKKKLRLVNVVNPTTKEMIATSKYKANKLHKLSVGMTRKGNKMVKKSNVLTNQANYSKAMSGAYKQMKKPKYTGRVKTNPVYGMENTLQRQAGASKRTAEALARHKKAGYYKGTYAKNQKELAKIAKSGKPLKKKGRKATIPKHFEYRKARPRKDVSEYLGVKGGGIKQSGKYTPMTAKANKKMWQQSPKKFKKSMGINKKGVIEGFQ